MALAHRDANAHLLNHAVIQCKNFFRKSSSIKKIFPENADLAKVVDYMLAARE